MKVLVIGDLIIDIRHEGRPLASSVIKHESSRVSAGGAGFLVRNLLALGGEVVFLTRVGGDEYVAHSEILTHNRLKKFALQDPKIKTIVKERFWAGGEKLLKWDRLDNRPSEAAFEKKIFNLAKNQIRDANKIIISDYRHGLISKSLAGKLVRLAKENKKPIYVDSQVAQSASNHAWYRGADLFCLNLEEAKSIDPEFSGRNLVKSLASIQKILNAENVILKLGENGSASFIGGKLIITPALKTRAVDSTGAGDAFFAVLSLSKDLNEKMLLAANIWAGLETALYGTETPSLRDFKKLTKFV